MANPYKTWKEVNAALPDVKIEVLGPPPTSGTRDAFLELGMEPGAIKFEWLKKLSKNDAKKFQKAFVLPSVRMAPMSRPVRTTTSSSRNWVRIPTHWAFSGSASWTRTPTRSRGPTVDGNPPTFENIASGKYPMSRPLFFYVKKAHVGVIPGIKEYLAEFTSEKAWGKDGYLGEKGLIPLPDAERKQVAET